MSQAGIVLLMMALSAQAQHQRAEQQEQSCLAEALYYEARGEGVRGEEAVAEVILARVRSRLHPDSICGVVHEPHQFSFLEDGSRKAPRDRVAWSRAERLSARIVRDGFATSLTHGATFYHAVEVQPAWSAEMIRTTQIGRHVFYRRPRSIAAEGGPARHDRPS